MTILRVNFDVLAHINPGSTIIGLIYFWIIYLYNTYIILWILPLSEFFAGFRHPTDPVHFDVGGAQIRRTSAPHCVHYSGHRLHDRDVEPEIPVPTALARNTRRKQAKYIGVRDV